MLRLDLAALQRDGDCSVAAAPHADELDLDPHRWADVHVRFTLRRARAAEQILVTVEAEATARLVCDRTLAEFRQPVRGVYRLLLAPPGSIPFVDCDEAVPLGPSKSWVDVTGAVRDTLMLAVPSRSVAPGAEDVEIPTVFGVPSGAVAVDVRWGALRAHRTETSTSPHSTQQVRHGQSKA